MIKALKNWWQARFANDNTAGTAVGDRTGNFARSVRSGERRKSDRRKAGSRFAAKADSKDENLHKDVLIRNKYIREDTGTHETLKILDDSLVDSGEETGIDPYNTGGFDRSRNWQTRFRK